MLNAPLRRQGGLTLIELMIAIALGLIIIAGVVYVAGGAMRTNVDTLRTTRLEQELRGVLLMVNRDLKRAGYYANAQNVLLCSANSAYTLTGSTATLAPGNGACNAMSIQQNDLIMNITGVGSGTVTTACATVSAVAGTTLTLTSAACPGAGAAVAFPSTTLEAGAWTIIKNGTRIQLTTAPNGVTGAMDCVTYSYDLDNDGQIEANEVYGFRYDATAKSIETLSSGGSLSDCTTGTWATQTDPTGIQITNFGIQQTDRTNTAATANVTMRELRITVTGTQGVSPVDGIPVTRTYTETVKVRNDLLN